MGPPYLITTGTDRRAVSVSVLADASVTVVQMTVHGRWSRDLGSQVAATLRRCLAAPVNSIIIDLCALGDRHGVSWSFWVAAVRAARLGPVPVQLALCLPPSTMLDHRLRHGDGYRPLVFATVPEARRATAAGPPRTHRMQLRLGPEPASVPAARDLVGRACHDWQLSAFRPDACLVMSELVANAVLHAGTDLVVTVARSGTGVHLSVRDGDPRYPHLAAGGRPGPLGERGRGLVLVHAVAAAWGVMPARGGKVVWATLSHSPDRPAT